MDKLNYEEDTDIIETALKVLEILRQKVIPYSPLNRIMIQRAFDEGWITQEEFDLLKEYFK